MTSATLLVSPAPLVSKSTCPTLDHKETLWRVFEELGAKGRLWDEQRMNCPTERAPLKATIFEDWSDTLALSSHSTTIGFWKVFATNRFDWRASGVHDVKAFLRTFRQRGPTVPHTRLSSLHWLKNYLGLECHSDDRAVRKSAEPPADHESHQAKAVSPKLLIVLFNMVRSSPRPVRYSQ